MAGFWVEAYMAAVIAALLTGIAVIAGIFLGPFFWLLGHINFSL